MKFCAASFSPDDTPWPGRPVEVGSDQIGTLTENNQRSTTRELADTLKLPKPSFASHLRQVGYVNRFDDQVPQKLSKKNFLEHMRFFT